MLPQIQAPQAITHIAELHALPPSQASAVVIPIADTETLLRAWDSFRDLKLKLLNDNDFVLVKGERYAKKSTFRKLALAFGISTEIVREDRLNFKEALAYLVTVKAISPNGRFMSACGSCHTDERRFTKDSDARSIAETRATNRAIANLIGWSAPSAEEIVGGGATEEEQIQSYPSKNLPKQENGMSSRQRSLLVSLINQKLADPDEREEALSALEGYDKQEASSMIKFLLSPHTA